MKIEIKVWISSIKTKSHETWLQKAQVYVQPVWVVSISQPFQSLLTSWTVLVLSTRIEKETLANIKNKQLWTLIWIRREVYPLQDFTQGIPILLLRLILAIILQAVLNILNRNLIHWHLVKMRTYRWNNL